MVAAPVFRNGMGEGFVLDRSTGGLRIAVTTPLEAGHSCRCGRRTPRKPSASSAFSSAVCRKSGEFYEIGCEFEKTPPWNVLLLFG